MLALCCIKGRKRRITASAFAKVMDARSPRQGCAKKTERKAEHVSAPDQNAHRAPGDRQVSRKLSANSPFHVERKRHPAHMTIGDSHMRAAASGGRKMSLDDPGHW